MRLGIQVGKDLWAFARQCRERLKAEHGLTYSASVDVNELMRTVALVKGEETNITSSFHPGSSVLNEANFWWSKLVDEKGGTVAYTVHRLIPTDDLIEDYALGRLFSDGAPDLDMGLPTMVDNPRIPPIAGRVLFAGGLWVTKRRRDEGIPRVYSPMGQALSLIRFNWDYFVILQKMNDEYHRRGGIGYGFKRSEWLSTGVYPPHGYVLDIAIAWKSRQELIDDILGKMNTGSKNTDA